MENNGVASEVQSHLTIRRGQQKRFMASFNGALHEITNWGSLW